MTEMGNLHNVADIGVQSGAMAELSRLSQISGDSAAGIANGFSGVLSSLLPGSNSSETISDRREFETSRPETQTRRDNGFAASRTGSESKQPEPESNAVEPSRETEVCRHTRASDAADKEDVAPDSGVTGEAAQADGISDQTQEIFADTAQVQTESSQDDDPVEAEELVSTALEGGLALLIDGASMDAAVVTAEVLQTAVGTEVLNEGTTVSSNTANTANTANPAVQAEQAAVQGATQQQTPAIGSEGVLGEQTPFAGQNLGMQQGAQQQAEQSALSQEAIPVPQDAETETRASVDRAAAPAAEPSARSAAYKSAAEAEIAPDAKPLLSVEGLEKAAAAITEVTVGSDSARPVAQDAAATAFGAVAASQQTLDTGVQSEGSGLSNDAGMEGREAGHNKAAGVAARGAEGSDFASKLGKAEESTRANQAESIERIIRSMRVATERGESRVRILLDPPRLGSVRVSMNIKDGVLNASFETQSQAARHIIAQDLPNLKIALEQQGIEVGEFSVNVEQGESQAQTADDRGQVFSGSVEGSVSDSDGEDEAIDIFSEQRRMTEGTSVLDLIA